jgi:CRP/FNR family transcriptional regulator
MRAKVAQLCAMKHFRSGETVQHETDGAQFVGFVVEGVLRLVKYRPDGHQHIIGLLFGGAMLGRLFDRMPPMTVEASTDAVICRFERHAFEALLMQHPELDAAHEGMLILSSPLKPERVATFLLQMWRHAGMRNPERRSVDTFKLPVTRVDMARYLGTSTETLSRILSRFAQEKVIDVIGRRTILPLDRDRLIELSGWDPDDWSDLATPDASGGPRALQGRSARAVSWTPPRRARGLPRSALG